MAKKHGFAKVVLGVGAVAITIAVTVIKVIRKKKSKVDKDKLDIILNNLK